MDNDIVIWMISVTSSITRRNSAAGILTSGVPVETFPTVSLRCYSKWCRPGTTDLRLVDRPPRRRLPRGKASRRRGRLERVTTLMHASWRRRVERPRIHHNHTNNASNVVAKPIKPGPLLHKELRRVLATRYTAVLDCHRHDDSLPFIVIL